MSSIRSTLQHFSYEQAIIYRGGWCGSFAMSRQRDHTYHTADVLFNAHILSVLVKGKWQCVNRLEICGVGVFMFVDRTVDLRISDYSPEGVAFVEGRFRDMLDEEVKLKVEPEGGKEYEELRQCDYGIPT